MRPVRLLTAVLPLALFAASRASGAPIASVFGGRVACGERDGVQFCEGGLDSRIESWDGVPLDVNVTLPPADRAGPFPVIVDLHGWGLAKTGAPQAARAEAGYIVVSYTARGFGQSCGSTASRAADPALSDPDVCVKRGWIRLADARYEARDTQHLAGLLADEGLAIPDRVGVTGISYGGGQSMILGALRNRVMLPDGTLVPWKSPGGRDMAIAAAAPLIPWSDLAQALTPNGRPLDYVADGSYGRRAGVQKKSWEDLLYTLGAANYYAPAGADPDADLPAWHARIGQGEPYDGDPLLEYALEQLTRYHSAYYIDDSVPPAPLFIYNSWVDDLFPGDEALRFWRKTITRHPTAEIALQLAAGFGHPRASLGDVGSVLRVGQRVDDFFARHLKGAAVPPPPAFETYTQACGGNPVLGPFIGSDWDAIRAGEVRFTDATTRTFTASGASEEVAKQLDPLGGSPCRALPANDDPGAATWRFPAATGAGYTLMGAPTIIAGSLLPSGSFAQVVGRLWDVAPDGAQTLVTHGIYRPMTADHGYDVFQLHPNGWHFAAGHVPKLELVGQSPPYGRSAGGRYWLYVGRLELRLPVVEAPNGNMVSAPASPVTRAGSFEWPDVGVPACGAAPATDCQVARKGTLVWKKGRLEWTWRGRLGSPANGTDALGRAESSTAYRLCAWDATSQLATSAGVPAGLCPGKQRKGTCWTIGKHGAWRYRDPAGESDGVRFVRFGSGTLKVRAKVQAAPVRRARAQLLVGGLGCFEAPVRR
jgi:predicted acyl esterase